MPDYQSMTAKEALREAKDVSGMTAEEIARGVGISPSHMRRYLDMSDNYGPSLAMIPELCRVMGNNILLQWQEAHAHERRAASSPASSRADVLSAVAAAGAALGSVQGLLSNVKIIHPANAREIRSGLSDVIAECRRVQEQLQAVAQARDASHSLACARDGERKPWWKVW